MSKLDRILLDPKKAPEIFKISLMALIRDPLF